MLVFLWAFLRSFYVIPSSRWETRKDEDNLHVLRIIPLFLNDVFLNSCLLWISSVISSHHTQLTSFQTTCSLPLLLLPFSPELIFVSICPLTTQLFVSSDSHAPAATVSAHQCSAARWVCSATLNHTGWAHLWKQMSTGAAMLFLFRLSFCVWLSATHSLPSSC